MQIAMQDRRFAASLRLVPVSVFAIILPSFATRTPSLQSDEQAMPP